MRKALLWIVPFAAANAHALPAVAQSDQASAFASSIENRDGDGLAPSQGSRENTCRGYAHNGRTPALERYKKRSRLQDLSPSLSVAANLGSRDEDVFTFAARRSSSVGWRRPWRTDLFCGSAIHGSGPGNYYDMDSIQVLRGPQGRLFGKRTTGGAICLSQNGQRDRTENPNPVSIIPDAGTRKHWSHNRSGPAAACRPEIIVGIRAPAAGAYTEAGR